MSWICPFRQSTFPSTCWKMRNHTVYVLDTENSIWYVITILLVWCLNMSFPNCEAKAKIFQLKDPKYEIWAIINRYITLYITFFWEVDYRWFHCNSLAIAHPSYDHEWSQVWWSGTIVRQCSCCYNVTLDHTEGFPPPKNDTKLGYSSFKGIGCCPKMIEMIFVVCFSQHIGRFANFVIFGIVFFYSLIC